MAVTSVGSALNAPAIESLVKSPATRPGAGKGDVSFADTIGDFLKNVNQQESKVDQSVEQLVTGKTDNIHDVVLSVAKADLSVRFLLEIRNRLLESYQEIMRMQM